MKIKAWYTYATEVLTYSNPAYKFISGIVKKDTADKLMKATQEDGGFLLLPKHVSRHIPTIFKESIQDLYNQSLSLIEEISSSEEYKTRKHKCEYCCGIEKIYELDFSDLHDRDFINHVSPLYPWTFEHVYQYLTGKDPEIPETVGQGALIVLNLSYLENTYYVEFSQANRDSSQVKSLDENINIKIDELKSVYNEIEYKRLCKLIDLIYQHNH